MAKGNSGFYQKAVSKPPPKPTKPAQKPASRESSEDAADGKAKKPNGKEKAKQKGKGKKTDEDSSSSSSDEDEGEPLPKAKRGRPASSPAPDKSVKKARHASPAAVKPRSAAFAKAMRALDATANEATRTAMKFDSLYVAIRIIVRLGHLSVDWTNVIVTGVAHHYLSDDVHPVWDSENYDDIVEAHQTFPLFLKHIKGFENHIEWLADNPDVMALAGDFAEKVATKVRGDDLARLRPEIINLARIPNPDQVLNDKANRGWESVYTGGLLVPAKFFSDFQKDPAALCRRAKAGELHIHSGDWPVLLYDMDQYNPKDGKDGLLRSAIGTRAYRLLFVSKKYAEGNDPQSGGKGQPPLCKKYHLKEVTLGSIIYTYILVRSCLTAQSQWNIADGLYWNCHDLAVTLFECAYQNADWCDELLAWWNKKIYGNTEDDEDLKAELRETTYAITMQNCTGRRQRPAPAAPTSRAGPSNTKNSAPGGNKTATDGDKVGEDDSEASGSNANPAEIEYAD